MLIIAIAVDGVCSPAGLIGRINGLTWTGGLFGAAFIGTAILMVPRLGAATIRFGGANSGGRLKVAIFPIGKIGAASFTWRSIFPDREKR